MSLTKSARTTAENYLPLLLCLLGVTVTLLWIDFINPRFFFVDDREAQYFPYGLIIRDELLQGEFPFLTTRTFYGSALWLDWQYGIYNPVSLLMNFLIMPQHLELSGLVFGLVSTLLVAAGAHACGRSYGLKPEWSALLGLVISLNPFLLYFTARSWHPGSMSLAWLLFSWAALKNLLAAEKHIASHTLVAALFMYLMVSAGWPHADIAFAVIAGVLFVEEWLKGGKPFRLIPAGVLGAAFSLPVVVPMLLAFPWTGRAALPKTVLLTPTLSDLINAGNPLWHPLMLTGEFGGHSPEPIFYLAWFVLPLLFLVDWKNLRALRLFGLLALVEIFFLMAAAGFGAALTLRYPLRWLPYVDVSALLALLLIVQEGGLVLTRRRIVLALASLALPALLALWLAPSAAGLTLGLFAAIFTALLFVIARREGNAENIPLFLGATSAVLLAMTVAAYPIDPDTLDWGKGDTTQRADEPQGNGVTYTMTATAFHNLPRGIKDEREYMTAAMGAYYHVNTINGYSSLGQRGLENIFHCTEYTFMVCRFPADLLLTQDTTVHAPYLDLLKVDRIVADKKPDRYFTRANELRGWSRKERNDTLLFERQPPLQLPGTLSWHSASVTVEEPAMASDNGETLQVKNGAKPGLLVFARLFYPGFRASLNDAPLTVRAVSDMLVGVEVPPGAAGTVTLSFLPPAFGICLALAGFSLLGWGAYAYREGRRG